MPPAPPAHLTLPIRVVHGRLADSVDEIRERIGLGLENEVETFVFTPETLDLLASEFCREPENDIPPIVRYIGGEFREDSTAPSDSLGRMNEYLAFLYFRSQQTPIQRVLGYERLPSLQRRFPMPDFLFIGQGRQLGVLECKSTQAFDYRDFKRIFGIGSKVNICGELSRLRNESMEQLGREGPEEPVPQLHDLRTATGIVPFPPAVAKVFLTAFVDGRIGRKIKFLLRAPTYCTKHVPRLRCDRCSAVGTSSALSLLLSNSPFVLSFVPGSRDDGLQFLQAYSRWLESVWLQHPAKFKTATTGLASILSEVVTRLSPDLIPPTFGNELMLFYQDYFDQYARRIGAASQNWFGLPFHLPMPQARAPLAPDNIVPRSGRWYSSEGEVEYTVDMSETFLAIRMLASDPFFAGTERDVNRIVLELIRLLVAAGNPGARVSVPSDLALTQLPIRRVVPVVGSASVDLGWVLEEGAGAVFEAAVDTVLTASEIPLSQRNRTHAICRALSNGKGRLLIHKSGRAAIRAFFDASESA